MFYIIKFIITPIGIPDCANGISIGKVDAAFMSRGNPIRVAIMGAHHSFPICKTTFTGCMLNLTSIEANRVPSIMGKIRFLYNFRLSRKLLYIFAKIFFCRSLFSW